MLNILMGIAPDSPSADEINQGLFGVLGQIMALLYQAFSPLFALIGFLVVLFWIFRRTVRGSANGRGR